MNLDVTPSTPELAWSDSVRYFRPRRSGPETVLEDAVVAGVPELISAENQPVWVAGYLPVGAGFPDITIAVFRHQLLELPEGGGLLCEILAYLRVVRKAKAATIAARLGHSSSNIDLLLGSLADAGAVTHQDRGYILVEEWRSILPEVVTVEVKVSNWKGAVQQAVRNQLFSHRSYIAVPESIAGRAAADELVRRSGIGVLGVNTNGQFVVIKRPRARIPTLWSYYYRVALHAAAPATERQNALSGINARRRSGVS